MLLGFLLVWVRAAHADDPPSVAVLPLEKAAASAEYDGLGRALAGMVVSDLSALPGLRLVERDRLDALLQEMKLKDTGFLDAKTAQTLGKGIGARFVVAGSFTVVEPTFALDARIVEVQTGEIVKAADAHGTVADFVAVEKDLVESLVTGLDLTLSSSDRRKLMLQAPTERFTAFTAYGEGLAREQEGKLDEAKTAYTRALSEDPAFAEAQTALGGLEALLKKREAERAGGARAARQAAYEKVLAEVPDERTLPKDTEQDQMARAAFAVRMGVLEATGRACDRYAEMRDYLERHHWQTAERTLAWAIGEYATPLGLGVLVDDPDRPLAMRKDFRVGAAQPFQEPSDFLFDPDGRGAQGYGMVESLLACYAPKEALAELDALKDAAKAARVATQPMSGNGRGRTIDDAFEETWMSTRASTLGADAELTQRIEAYLDAHKGGPLESWSTQIVDDVVRSAQAWRDHQVRRRGLPADEIFRRTQLVADGKLRSSAVCKQAQTLRAGAASWVSFYSQSRLDPDNLNLPDVIDSAFGSWAAPADYGCIEGVAPRFSSDSANWAYFDSAHTRALAPAPDGCDATWIRFDQTVEQTRAQRKDPNLQAIWLFNMDLMWLGLVQQGCAHE
jgi:TolB-like protein